MTCYNSSEISLRTSFQKATHDNYFQKSYRWENIEFNFPGPPPGFYLLIADYSMQLFDDCRDYYWNEAVCREPDEFRNRRSKVN